MPRVSVVIPTHNRPDFLRAAISSVLHQTFEDFELVIVDDASETNTLEVVDSFHDRRLKLIRHENRKGGSAARNTGIVNSRGAYVAFLDDDDEWLPEKLRLQVDLLQNSPARVGIVYSGYLAVERATGEVWDVRRPTRKGDLSEQLLQDNWVGSPSSVLARRECFQNAGLFDESLPSFQDYDLWIRISRTFLIDCISEPLFRFNCHGNRIWTNLEALDQGTDMMLSKYGHTGVARRNFSYRYLYLGVRHCEAGESIRGRQALRKAISLHPLEARHYFNLCLSFLGTKYFRALKETKDKLIGPLRSQVARPTH